MSVDDFMRIKDIPFAPQPNGGFVLHLPDEERLAKHPITDKYLLLLECIKENHASVANFSTMSMGSLHPKVTHIFESATVHEMWSRAGNLLREAILRPELMNVKDRFKSVYHGEEPMTCNCDERLYHNVLLPNGDVSLCCMDYGLKQIIGNLRRQEYEEVVPEPYSCYDMCRFCENGISPDDARIVQEIAIVRTK
jgi:hypothetical protein